MEFSFRGDNIRRWRDQSGQAVTEYILVLFFILGIAFGGIYMFNDAIKVWANNYFGDYLTCLLETGELPSIGGAPGDSGICNQFFKEFSLSAGRPYKTLTDSPGTGKVSRSASTGDDASKSGNKTSRGMNEGSSRGSRGGSGGGRGCSGNNLFNKPSPNANADNGGGASKKIVSSYTGSTDADANGGGGYRGMSRRRTEGGQLSRGFYVSIDKDEKERPAGFSVPSQKNEGGYNTSKKIPIKTILKKDPPQADEPFTIGNFIRLLIIAALIIALVLVIGGQLLQVSKNSE